MLKSALETVTGREIRFRNAMDLGCGTGLSGAAFRPNCDRLSGIDLSPNMIEAAREKELYDSLEVGDFLTLLREKKDPFDLVIAADVLVYIGDLAPVFQSVRSCLNRDGYLVFSTEKTDREGYVLRDTGRYAHSREYIESLAERSGFSLLACRTANIRKDREAWIEGNLFVLGAKA
ncbi:MAG: hypothetical protein DRH56_07065 [Deltaproteobacteria bacterium]|nr:MAG: hypothetical protein DRH56_07065 [Deltaproteobacteria bacterium]